MNVLRTGLLLLMLCEVYALEHGDVCTNPDGLQGTCIEVRSCPSLLSVIQVKPLPRATVVFLRSSQCGFQGSNPLVCCTSNNQSTNVTIPKPVENEETEDVSEHRNFGLLRMDICGPVYPSRIYSGTEANLMEVPWMALLAYNVQSGSPFRCGGSIINDRYVLTAAHCVEGLQSNLSLVSVRLGELNLTSAIDCELYGDKGSEIEDCAPAPQDIPVERVIPHPKYVGKPDIQYDAALVRLSQPANFTSDAVQPICLPYNLALQTENLVGKNLFVSGWGTKENLQPSPVLRKWYVPIISHPECSSAFEGEHQISSVDQICARDRRDGRDACFGDSSGPLTGTRKIRSSHRNILYGIFSYGPEDCHSSSKPSVYTSVGHIVKWILDTIEQ